MIFNETGLHIDAGESLDKSDLFIPKSKLENLIFKQNKKYNSCFSTDFVQNFIRTVFGVEKVTIEMDNNVPMKISFSSGDISSCDVRLPGLSKCGYIYGLLHHYHPFQSHQLHL